MEKFFDIQRFASVLRGDSGNNSITNENNNVVIYTYEGIDTINNTGDSVTVYAGADRDYLHSDGAHHVVLNGDSGTDNIFNGDYYNYSIITKGGNYALLNGGTDNDNIENYSGNYVTIKGGAGQDSLWNITYGKNGNLSVESGHHVLINGEGDNDTIISAGANTTINGDAGNDYISNGGYPYYGDNTAQYNFYYEGYTIDNPSPYDHKTYFGYYYNHYGCYVGGGSNVIMNGGEGKDKLKNLDGKNVTMNGGNGDDSIKNFNGKNVKIDGGAGIDSIYSYSGRNNLISGGADDDLIFADHKDVPYYRVSYNVTVKGESGNDQIETWGYYSSVDGGGGNDYIYAGGKKFDKKASLMGGSGNDTIISLSDSSYIVGGTGRDIISLASDSAYNTVKYSNGDGNDTVYGMNSQDTLKITNGKYTSVASGSDLKINVGTGSILIVGGLDAGFKINGTKDAPPISVSGGVVNASSSYTGNSINLANYSGATKINASAASKSLHLIGNGQANSLRGGTGNDTLNGYGGNDTLTGGKGNDIFVYSAGNDAITDYTAGQDKIRLNGTAITSYSASGNNLILRTSKGNINVHNGKGKSITVIDSNGNQTSKVYVSVSGGSGSSTSVSLPTGLTYEAYKTGVKANSSYSSNKIDVSKFIDSVVNINAANMTKGMNLIGNGQANSLRGGTGNDTLNGYGGNDSLTGGKGNDIFVYSAGNDVITDYTAGQDKIRLSDVSITGSATSGNHLILRTSKGHITIQNGKGKNITIINSSGSQSTKKYRVASSQSQTWNLICDDNFIGNETRIDDISEAKYSVTQIQTAKTELTQEQPVLTYGNSENRQ